MGRIPRNQLSRLEPVNLFVEVGRITPCAPGPAVQTNTASARAGHSVGDNVRSLNTAFADDHVDTHPRSVIQWQYAGNATAFY